jgi:predicted amidohydrolase
MRIALASPRIATSLEEGLEKVRAMMGEAAARGAGVVCFPEAFLPGLRGQDFEVGAFDPEDYDRVVDAVSGWSRANAIAAIVGTERPTGTGRENVAVVLGARGERLGFQAKNQLDPSEDPHYAPGHGRRLFEVGGLAFGIAICHEGWRYPETVRWAAVRGARIVFHPQLTGSDRAGTRPVKWGDPESAYYEKAMMCRGLENTIYFASVNYALRFPESATSLIDPSGRCQASLPYGEEGVLVQEIDPDAATGLLARRYAPERYGQAEAVER